MRTALLISILTLAAGPAMAQAVTRPLASLDATLTGQPITAPSGPLRVTVSETTIPAGGRLAAHKHPYPRVVQVLSGRLRVTNLDTGTVSEPKPGDWLVDAVEQWHEAVVLGDEPVRLMTIDQAPPGAAVTIPR
ncbi:cupin domain-containing protein [Phenylobacterium sp. J426]|uniref:cupin domain-containing protein n=1 Tax=Phenylobacterium sp. J426 TaxID=2898439 RepID=UPI002150DC9E|nr:cupin domain-containing protein [Phenylobacterium sp. J426]MCR5872836.1 cupin domain-containing protein [Phenylobacterium sp. J426]